MQLPSAQLTRLPLQTHIPASHAAPDPQGAHATPSRPQKFWLSPWRQVEPSQQPLQLAEVQVIGGQSVPQQASRGMHVPWHRRSLARQSQVPSMQTRPPAQSASAQQAATAIHPPRQDRCPSGQAAHSPPVQELPPQ
jgi:hypothetical protein